MQSIFTSSYIQSIINHDFLLLGKGPSYASINEIDLSNYISIALNHVIRETKVTIAHLIDFDVFEACQAEIYNNAKYLVLPWLPHKNNRPGNNTLSDYLKDYPLLKKLSEEKRLLWYNLATAKSMVNGINPEAPIIPTGSFSASVIVNLLAALKIKNIATLGIDGGNTYHTTFDNLKDKTLLNNGWNSFNRQFREINKTVNKFNIKYQSLAIESPIKIYVGSAKEQWLAFKVLAYSIQKYASTSVEVKPLYEHNIKWNLPKDAKNKPRTPFSFQRFLIPELNGFKGKAIYLDSDMLVFTDIVDLWHRPMGNTEIFAAYKNDDTSRLPQFSVMLMNCDLFQYSIAEIIQLLDEGKFDYQTLMHEMKIAKNLAINIEPEWNSLEYYEAGQTKLLHYTDMYQQPWLSNRNINSHLWLSNLKEAIEDNFISYSDLLKEVISGNVKPSLFYQITYNCLDSKKLSIVPKFLDSLFTPPHLRSKKRFPIQFLGNTMSLLGHFIVYISLIIPYLLLSLPKLIMKKLKESLFFRKTYYKLKSKK